MVTVMVVMVMVTLLSVARPSYWACDPCVLLTERRH
jgi:hypothetical protein